MPFTALSAESFIGRQGALDDLWRLAAAARDGGARSRLLDGPRGAGKTELLRRLFAALFWKQDDVVPFFYPVSAALLDAADFARDYLSRFLCQHFAFEGRDQTLLFADGAGLAGLSSLAHSRDAAWAIEVLDRFRRSEGSPVELLLTALHAPLRSAGATGKPVAVMIDDFHLLAGLRRGGAPDPGLAALFDGPFRFPRTPHLVAGIPAAVDEMAIAPLSRYAVGALTLAESNELVQGVLRSRGIEAGPAPEALLTRLGGNPFYLRAVAEAVEARQTPEERDYWDAYLREAGSGSICRSWTAALRSAFPDPGLREQALRSVHAVTAPKGPADRGMTTASFLASQGAAGPAVLGALVRAGLVQAGLSSLTAPPDAVYRDVIELLHEREIRGASPEDAARSLQGLQSGPEEDSLRVDLVLPGSREAELVAARCLEQVGRSRNVPAGVIGQLQVALIEACINAIEHGRDAGRRIPVAISVEPGRITVAVESPGMDFVPAGAAEPLAAPAPDARGTRGWGIKLMKRFCDSVRFERTPRGTHVVLTKTWSPATETAKEDDAGREQFHPFTQD